MPDRHPATSRPDAIQPNLRGTSPDGASPPPPRLHHPLLADGSFVLRSDTELLPAIHRWLPRFLDTSPAPHGDPGAVLDLRVAAAPLPPPPHTPPTLRLASVQAWVSEDRATLHAAHPAAGGRLDLATRRALLQAPPPPLGTAEPGMDAFTLLTVASALLLARTARALLHSAAIVSPHGRAWLLVGDTHAGKTTTTLNLVRAGHGFVSDDHVVLGRATHSDPPFVEGWPRTFHVDEGWSRGEITGRRIDFDPASLQAGRWRRTAPLGGLLFPRVDALHPTAVQPLSPAEALTRVIRQSPWFLADRAATAGVLELLKAVVQLPAFELRLGRDSYADPELLDARLHTLDGLAAARS